RPVGSASGLSANSGASPSRLFYHWRRVLAEENTRLAGQSSGLPAKPTVEGKGEVRFALVAPYRPASTQDRPASTQARSAHAGEAGDDAGQAGDASGEVGYPEVGVIELLLDRGWRLRIGRGAEETTLRTVLAALAAMSPAQ
ncbi:MAG: hypothetical protein HC834_00495, partial [Rhodospirillales bacterium]|nr:hypothetical protein [Rhodospirillales bacterium]